MQLLLRLHLLRPVVNSPPPSLLAAAQPSVSNFLLLVVVLVSTTLLHQVAAVAVTRNGQVVGLRPTAMLLAEPTLTPPSSGLPGRPLDRERLPVR